MTASASWRAATRACKFGWEGIVSMRLGSTYRSGRCQEPGGPGGSRYGSGNKSPIALPCRHVAAR
jgi:hypothetical protein